MRAQNTNRGENVTVDPIRDIAAIDAIKKMLAGKPRDQLLFTMGINNGLRTGDILRLRVKDVKSLKAGDSVMVKESKTGKTNVLMVNKSVYKALRGYLETVKPLDDDWLFPSRKGGAALTTASVNGMIKNWTKAINLRGNFGAHSMRKTFGYIQRTRFGVGLEILMKRFNHSSPLVTMRYLGITSEEVVSILNNEI